MLNKFFLVRTAQFLFLVAVWLGAYKLASLLEVFRPYSSLWFLPAGVSLSIFLGVPGLLKLSPLVANLLLAVPMVGPSLIGEDVRSLEQVLHAVRHCGIYALAAAALKNVSKQSWDGVTLKQTMLFIVVCGIAAIASAISGVTLHVLLGNFDWQVAGDIVVQWAIGDAVAALVLPPLLTLFLRQILLGKEAGVTWPKWPEWVLEIGVIALAMGLGILAGKLNPSLGGLWYLALLPPIFAGVRSGLPGASISVFFTTLTMPVAAYYMQYSGEMLALSLLLVIGTIAALLIGTVVSMQQRTLAALDMQNRKLEQLVRARTADFEEANQFQRHLVRSLGHDLRQPLQTILMLVEGLSFEDKGRTEVVGHIRQISRTMSNFLEGILNYARHDPGVVTPKLAMVSLVEMFDDLESVYGPVAESRGVVLDVQRVSVFFISDQVLLTQALANDLDNAIRLSQSGMRVVLRHEIREGKNALLVCDEIVVEYAHPPGTAGFGYGIVARICTILGAARIKSKNIRGVLLSAGPAGSKT